MIKKALVRDKCFVEKGRKIPRFNGCWKYCGKFQRAAGALFYIAWKVTSDMPQGG